MYAARRTHLKPVFIALALVTLFLTACGRSIGSNDWPSLSNEGNVVYVSFGPGVMAVDVDQRRELWRYPTEAQGQLQFYAAPAFEDDRLYVGDYGASGGFFSPGVTVSIYALENLDSGAPTLAWQNDTSAQDRIIAQPLASGERVYVGTADDVVFAMDANSGDEIWQFATEQAIWGQPTLVDWRVFVSSLDRSVYALDESDGSEIWKVTFDAAVASKPVVADGRVYVGGFDSVMHVLDAGDGSELWSFEADDWIWSAPTVVDGIAYFGSSSGDFYALDVASGDVQWRFAANGPIKAEPVVHDGVVYVAAVSASTETPEGHLLALNAADGELIWERTTPASIFTQPAIVGDSLVAAVQSDEALLLLFELATGDLQWEFTPDQ